MRPQPTPSSNQTERTPNQSLFSLIILLHLVVVGLALLCSVDRSSLQHRLGNVLGCYTRSLKFVPARESFQLVYGDTLDGDNKDDDHVVEIEIPASMTDGRPSLIVEYPPPGSNWSLNQQRSFRLTHLIGYFADLQADDACAAIAQELAWQEMERYNVDQVQVRCYRRMTQPMLLQDLPKGFPAADPTDPAYDRAIYTADVFLAGDTLQVAKKSTNREVAPRDDASGGS